MITRVDPRKLNRTLWLMAARGRNDVYTSASPAVMRMRTDEEVESGILLASASWKREVLVHQLAADAWQYSPAGAPCLSFVSTEFARGWLEAWYVALGGVGDSVAWLERELAPREAVE